MNTTVRVAGAVNDSIVDGPGIRFALFVQGCTHECIGCHNPKTHDLQGGHDTTIDLIWSNIEGNGLLDGITLSGGEPLLQPTPLLELVKRAHESGLDVWLYTGFLFEQVLEGTPSPEAAKLIRSVDVVVDGPFVESEKSLEIKWCGSTNQRIIDVAASLAAGEVVLFCD